MPYNTVTMFELSYLFMGTVEDVEEAFEHLMGDKPSRYLPMDLIVLTSFLQVVVKTNYILKKSQPVKQNHEEVQNLLRLESIESNKKFYLLSDEHVAEIRELVGKKVKADVAMSHVLLKDLAEDLTNSIEAAKFLSQAIQEQPSLIED